MKEKNNNLSEIMAYRLKQYRGALSHVALKNALEAKYNGFSISKDSLINYEKANSDKQPNIGMSVEKLYYLSDFYGVSADYLLGKTDTPATEVDIRAIAEYTGLDVSAIELLHTWKSNTDERTNHGRAYINILNKLFGNFGFYEFLDNVFHYSLLENHDYAKDTSKVRELVVEHQNQAMKYMDNNDCSLLEKAFLALKSNLNNTDIAEFYLNKAIDEIKYIITHTKMY